MTSLVRNYDWKQAAQQAMPDDAAEQAFMANAMGYIANRAGVLMQDQHRLGFEVVYKNTENTRMVGIFAFRLNDELLYVPVFFINGTVKGYDLLQRTKTKTFVPFTEEWTNFLAEKRMPGIGKGIPHNQSRNTPNSLELIRLAYPPFNAKWANHTPTEDELNEAWEGVFDELSKEAKLEPVLGQFMKEDGGQDAFTKLAALVDSNPKFAEFMNFECDADDWCTDLPNFHAKEAKQAAAPELVLYTGPIHAEFAKSASADDKQEFFKQGYKIDDRRAEDALSIAYVHNQSQIEQIGRPGVYKVLGELGELTEAFVANVEKPSHLFERAPRSKNHGSFYRDASVVSAAPYSSNYSNERPMVTVITEDGRSAIGQDKVYGYYIAYDLPQIDAQEKFPKYFQKEMKANKAYFIYNQMTGAVLPRAVYCLSVEDGKDGLKCYSVVQCDYGHEHAVDLRFNPDVQESDYRYGSLGSATLFIPVEIEEKQEPEAGSPAGAGSIAIRTKEFCPASPDQFDAYVMSDAFSAQEPVKMAKMRVWLGNDNCYYIKAGNHVSPGLGRIKAHVYLTATCGLHEKVAGEILDTGRKGIEFTLEQKSGSVIRPDNVPMFRQDYNSDFGIPEEYPQAFAIPTTSSYQRPPANHIGDGEDPAMHQGYENEDSIGDEPGGIPEDVLMNAPAEQIGQMAQSGQFPRVFEHGVIGSLVDTYDSMAMIDKYLPKMEQAVDAMGRSLFLFYWKPQDFEKVYGVDDMTNMENKLLSCFKSLGDLVLDLLKRSQKAKGSVNAISS